MTLVLQLKPELRDLQHSSIGRYLLTQVFTEMLKNHSSVLNSTMPVANMSALKLHHVVEQFLGGLMGAKAGIGGTYDCYARTLLETLIS